ncbi:E3 ubiquitin-protein ligase TRIM39-like [Xenentodon cancila]
MSASCILQTEDPFLCSICLDVFTDPVSTPCGHNFCKNCITNHWDLSDLSKCPICNEVFYSRPLLRVNTFIREMVAQFRDEAQQKARKVAKPGEVPCDICRGTKLKALKSCLVCLVSYCEMHLEAHLTVSGLKRHQLINPVENLEGRMCMKHNKPLELFCMTDETCVCMLCSLLEHKTHEVAPLREKYEEKKAELKVREAEIQHMIHKRELKIQEIKKSVWTSDEAADRETMEGFEVFTSLTELVTKCLNEFTKGVDERQKELTKQAEGFIDDLQNEISELIERSRELEQLSRSEDHLHLLQSISTLKADPMVKEWSDIRVHPASYEGTVARAAAQLEDTFSKEVKKLFEAELKRVQRSAVDVTLDPDTANPQLNLSDDGKQVSHCDVKRDLPDNPERFSYYVFVIAEQSFSSGRLYFEVDVKGKTKWNLGVVRDSVKRKGLIKPRPQNGFWVISLRNGDEYKALASTSVCLSLKSCPQKVGVFVDYEQGVVCFYDVMTAALIYTFADCSFDERLYPFFCPGINDGGKNSAPLVICPVIQTD